MASELDGLVESIKAGDFDGHLVDVLEAVRLRFTHGQRGQRWTITFDDVTYREDDLTLAEASTVEKLTGTNWGMLNPVSSATECQSIVAACLHHRNGDKLPDAVKRVGGWTAKEAAEAISSYEVEEAPKD